MYRREQPSLVDHTEDTRPTLFPAEQSAGFHSELIGKGHITCPSLEPVEGSQEKLYRLQRPVTVQVGSGAPTVYDEDGTFSISSGYVAFPKSNEAVKVKARDGGATPFMSNSLDEWRAEGLVYRYTGQETGQPSTSSSSNDPVNPSRQTGSRRGRVQFRGYNSSEGSEYKLMPPWYVIQDGMVMASSTQAEATFNSSTKELLLTDAESGAQRRWHLGTASGHMPLIKTLKNHHWGMNARLTALPLPGPSHASSDIHSTEAEREEQCIVDLTAGFGSAGSSSLEGW